MTDSERISPSDALGLEGEAAPKPPGPRRSLTARILSTLAVVLVAAGIAIFFGEPVPGTDHYGFGSVLPALVTLALVFLTREVVSALFAGIVVGGLVSAEWNIIDAYLIPSLATEDFIIILLVYLWALGGLIGLWTRTGGAQYFATRAGEWIVRGPRSAKFFGWFMGVVFHQGGTVSTILTGTTVRPVTDAERVSHEEISYVVDSTASPVATLIPLNAWPLYVSGLIAGTTPLFATEEAARSFFFTSLPFNFYAIFAVLMTLLFSWNLLPWEGKRMRQARERARDTGKLNSDHAKPLDAEELTELKVPGDYRPGLEDFLIPLVVLIGVAATGVVPALPALFTGNLAGISIDIPIAEAFGLSVLSAAVLAMLKGMSVAGVVEGFIDGAKGVTIGALILAFAVTLGSVSESLGAADYISAIVGESIPFSLLPAIFLTITMGIAFSAGTSWGTYAVFFPVAMPLAYQLNPDPFFMTLCFGAVLGGSVMGDQCSPISDTTVLSSLATGSDLMDHVLTQLPLALVAAGLAAILYTLLAVFAV